MAQSVVLGRERCGLVRKSAAQFGVLPTHFRDLLLLLLYRLDDGGGQLAIGNAIGAILVVLPFDQRQPVLGFRSLDGVVQRCRQRLLEVLRDKAIALGPVAIVKTVGYRLEFFDEIEAEIRIEEMLSSPTRLAVHFTGPVDFERADDPDVEQCRYAYEVLLGGPAGEPHRVLNERLIYWPVHVGRYIRLFDRDEQGKVRAGRAFALAGYVKPLEKILRPNVSVICTLAQLGHPAATVLWRAAAGVCYNILVQKSEVNDEAVAKNYADNPTLLERLNRDLERIGLGVRAMRLQQGTNGPVAWFEHEGLSGLVPALLESNGTRQFIRIFPLIFQALEFGSVAIIDELDLTIHPLVLPEIVRWFHDPERNPHNAQLWMTCQSAPLLEELIKEEVLLCEKGPKTASGKVQRYLLRQMG
jgi:hypothetical protein